MLGWIDLSMVLIPLAVIVCISMLARNYTRSVSDFLSAGRSAGRYLICVADGTAGLGLISVVGTFEYSYKCGFAIGFWGNIGALIALVMTLTGFVTYRFRETRAFTMAQFYEMRYSRGFRIYAATLAFISGLINYAIFPSVAGRFVVYYCGLPFSFNFLGIQMNTYGFLMAVFLIGALIIVLLGGQLTNMVSDCTQGIFGYFAYAVIVFCILWIFKMSDIEEAIMSRPEGESFMNPFNVGKMSTFNLLYILIGIFSSIYNRNAWLGNQGYMCSAANPHEQKMAGVLGSWRAGYLNLALMLLVLGAYAYLNTSNFAAEGSAVRQELHERTSIEFPITADMTGPQVIKQEKQQATIENQMLVSVALRRLLPVGVTGIFLALMLFLMISTDTTYLHSWGSIFIQDIVLPIYNKPISPKKQVLLLRLSIIGVAVFAWFFSFYFAQGDYVFQFFAMTGTIYLGGAGACMLGGLYWKRGTSAGAYAAMTVGLLFALIGFALNTEWGAYVYPYLAEHCPEGLETFRCLLRNLGDMLPFANWDTEPEIFAKTFPISSQEVYLVGMICALLSYYLVSIVTCKKDFNMDKMLNRGEYNLEHVVNDNKAVKKSGFDFKRSFVGITEEYTRGDRILAWSVFIYSMYGFAFFLVKAIWNLPPSWRWSELTWFKLWEYYELPLTCLIGIVTTVWFTWGGVRDLTRLFRDMKNRSNEPMDESDNGSVQKENE